MTRARRARLRPGRHPLALPHRAGAPTAIALRGGLLRWPWALFTASMLSWLFYDAASTLGHTRGARLGGASRAHRGVPRARLLLRLQRGRRAAPRGARFERRVRPRPRGARRDSDEPPSMRACAPRARPRRRGQDAPRVASNVAARGSRRTPRGVRSKSGAPSSSSSARDLAAERRLRDVQPARRARHVPLLGDGDEVAELREAHRRSQRSTGRARGAGIPKRYWIRARRARHGSRHGDRALRGRPMSRALRRAGRVAAATLARGRRAPRAPASPPRTSTAGCARTPRGAADAPSQLGYKGFPGGGVHQPQRRRLPRDPAARDERLRDGDIVNVDVTTDARRLPRRHVGDVLHRASPSAERAARRRDVARRCRDAGIAVVRDGARLGDIGAAIEELARARGLQRRARLRRPRHRPRRCTRRRTSPHVGARGTGLRLRAGMAITIEPMINLGGARRAACSTTGGRW